MTDYVTVAHDEGIAIIVLDNPPVNALSLHLRQPLFKALSEEPAVLAGLTAQPGLALFGGGLPIIAEGTVIGGIGVSGASADQDEDCAQAGLGAIGLG